MIKTLLIHGYAAGLQTSVFPNSFGQHAGFRGLIDEIKQGSISLFQWGVMDAPTWRDLVNPIAYYRLYRNEESLAASQTTQHDLYQRMVDENPSTLIAHSLGCRLLLNTVNSLDLPPSVERIVFLQADFSRSECIEHAGALDRLANQSLTLENYHCIWDPSLATSAILHRTPRAGMLPWPQAHVHNHFFPLLRPINLHTSPLRDRAFLRSLIHVEKSIDVR